MKTDPYILLRKGISQFCRLDDENWALIKSLFIAEVLPKNYLFAEEGKNATRFGFVCSGCLRMYNLKESGKELTKHFSRSEDFIVGAINSYNKNSVSIETISKCELLVSDYKILDELSGSNKAISDFKNNLVSKFVQIKQNRENSYLTMESTERYKLFLQEFANLINQIPHHFIASYLGISATQLSRVRNKIANT